MSRNFEEEYRQMIDSELPDLWDRIEAQLPDVAAASEVSERISSVSETSKTGNAGADRRRKRFPDRRMRSVIAAAAAILCILAALPVLFLPRKDMSDSEANIAAQEDGAVAGGSMDTAETAADCGADEYYENSLETLPEEPIENGDAGTCMPEDADFMTEMAEPTSDNTDTQGIAGIAPTDGSQSGAEAEATEEEPDLYQVEVRILDCIQGEQGETYYEAAVLQNAENGVEDEIRLYFRCAGEGEAQNNRADVSFRQGETYVLCLYGSGETVEDYGADDRNGDLYENEMYIVYEVIAKKK